MVGRWTWKLSLAQLSTLIYSSLNCLPVLSLWAGDYRPDMSADCQTDSLAGWPLSTYLVLAQCPLFVDISCCCSLQADVALSHHKTWVFSPRGCPRRRPGCPGSWCSLTAVGAGAPTSDGSGISWACCSHVRRYSHQGRRTTEEGEAESNSVTCWEENCLYICRGAARAELTWPAVSPVCASEGVRAKLSQIYKLYKTSWQNLAERRREASTGLERWVAGNCRQWRQWRGQWPGHTNTTCSPHSQQLHFPLQEFGKYFANCQTFTNYCLQLAKTMKIIFSNCVHHHQILKDSKILVSESFNVTNVFSHDVFKI